MLYFVSMVYVDVLLCLRCIMLRFYFVSVVNVEVLLFCWLMLRFYFVSVVTFEVLLCFDG